MRRRVGQLVAGHGLVPGQTCVRAGHRAPVAVVSVERSSRGRPFRALQTLRRGSRHRDIVGDTAGCIWRCVYGGQTSRCRAPPKRGHLGCFSVAAGGKARCDLL